MKISELIQKLKYIEQNYGDINVKLKTSTGNNRLIQLLQLEMNCKEFPPVADYICLD